MATPVKIEDLSDADIEEKISQLTSQREIIQGNLLKLATERQRRVDPTYWKARFEAERKKKEP